MRFTAAPLFFAVLAAAVPLETSEDVAFLESRAGPAIDPHLFIIDTPVTSGTGCPRGSASVVFDKDFQAFTVNFDKYQVQTGPAPLTGADSVKNCKVTLLVGFDKGYTFSVLTTDLEGFASLEPGVTGKAITEFSFTGGSGKPKWQLNFNGPFDDTFDLTADPNLIVSSPCGAGTATLNINTQVALNPLAPSSKKGLIGVSDLQGFLRQKFHIKWAKC
ncbi:hypothetical protein GP486_007504 [Trichoglossum hirsutum]|uniref:Secreted protein n=1 Tax=Trichoglossum hirsutum TaxID=265104 RepID=A0A9P8I688_9PEZI|nr:hypothetical protein GP486_007504 [Trichoglossum hirsutum]